MYGKMHPDNQQAEVSRQKMDLFPATTLDTQVQTQSTGNQNAGNDHNQHVRKHGEIEYIVETRPMQQFVKECLSETRKSSANGG